MAKTTTTEKTTIPPGVVLPSIKEETLNQIVIAQKEKITALTEYGKKLKKQLKDAKESIDDNCQELIETFELEKLNTEHLNQKVLMLGIIAALLLGVLIGINI